MPVMMMGAPVPMWVPVIAPRRVSPIIGSVTIGAVVPPAHHDRGGSDDNGRWDTEADVDIDAGLSGLRLRKQDESQEGDRTPHAYDMGETFHTYILTVEHQLCSTIGRVLGDMHPPICHFVVHSSMIHTRSKVTKCLGRHLEYDLLLFIYYPE